MGVNFVENVQLRVIHHGRKPVLLTFSDHVAGIARKPSQQGVDRPWEFLSKSDIQALSVKLRIGESLSLAQLQVLNFLFLGHSAGCFPQCPPSLPITGADAAIHRERSRNQGSTENWI